MDHVQQLCQQLILSTSTPVEEQLGSILKTFFKLTSTSAATSSKGGLAAHEALLVDLLSQQVQKKELEIEKLCNVHYKDFTMSADNLSHINAQIQQIKQSFAELSRDFSAALTAVLSRKKRVGELMDVSASIEETLDLLRACLFIFELTAKIDYLVDDQRKYYSALKALDMLDKVHLRKLEDRIGSGSGESFTFVRMLRETVMPRVRQKIKNVVMAQLKDWFVAIREWSRQVGSLAMEQTFLNNSTSHGAIVTDIQMKMKNLSRSSSSMLAAMDQDKQRRASSFYHSHNSRQSLSWQSIDAALDEYEELDLLNNEKIRVDFTALYQCIHIYEVLGLFGTIKSDYEENRRLQANLVLTTPFSLNENDLSGFEKYLHEIIGFFIVESHVVINTENHFRSRAAVDMLWETATDKLYQVITLSLENCQNPEHFLKIKELMITLIQTMENYQFNVAKLIDLLIAFFEQYCNLKMIMSSRKCTEAIETDGGNSITVKDEGEYLKCLQSFKYKAEVSKEELYPKTLPYSQSFVDSCAQIKSLIRGFYQFADGFHQQFNEIDDILKRSVSKLVVEYICAAIEKKFGARDIQISEVVRIIINLENFNDEMKEVEWMIAYHKRAPQRITSPKHIDVKIDQVRSSSAFLTICTSRIQEAKKKAEDRIFELVNRKIDDFLDLAEYNFCPAIVPTASQSAPASNATSPVKSALSPGNHAENDQPSPYLTDLIAYLDVVWNSALADLPKAIKSFIYYDAVYHIVSRIIGQLMAADVIKISPQFIENQLQTDVKYLEDFVERLGDPNLPDQLTEIRQVIDLLVPTSNPEEYLNASLRNRKYSRITKQMAISLLEKIRDSAYYNEAPLVQTSFFSALTSSQAQNKQNAKDKEKTPKGLKREQIENTIKSLKEP